MKKFKVILNGKSQSLHFLRAFQLWVDVNRDCFREARRNPFIFLGHFNPWNSKVTAMNSRRNPFIFLGHFNLPLDSLVARQVNFVAIPSFS